MDRVAINAAVVGMLTMSTFGCGRARPSVPTAPDTSGVIVAAGRFVAGCQVCPLGADLGITAAHCVDPRPLDDSSPMVPLRGESVNWHGLLLPEKASMTVDTADLIPVPAFTFWYDYSEARPTVGDTVTVVGFDVAGSNPFARRISTGRILGVYAGHLIMTAHTGHGSSGSCVLDQSGHAIGIVVAGTTTDSGRDLTIAVELPHVSE